MRFFGDVGQTMLFFNDLGLLGTNLDLLAPAWGQLGPNLAYLGPTWPTWAQLGAPTWPMWAQLGPNLGPTWATWGQLGASLGAFGQKNRGLGVTSLQKAEIVKFS